MVLVFRRNFGSQVTTATLSLSEIYQRSSFQQRIVAI